MKLLSKTSINYLWVSFTVMAITGVLLFFFILRTVSQEVKEQLELQSEMVAAQLRKGQVVSFPLLQISPGKASDYQQTEFKDTLVYDHIQQEREDYYYLSRTLNINGKPVKIKVMTTDIGWGGYQKAIGLIFIVMACMLVLAGALVNYFINKKIWKPFLLNLNNLKSFSISSQARLELIPSSIDEFTDLNAVLNDLAIRSRKEYEGLKEFTENASHEIQTPLMIIKSRLESISQLQLNEEIAGYLLDAKRSIDRLSRLNKGLLLLAKLDHDDFPDQQEVNLQAMLQSITTQMEDLFEQRNMKLSVATVPKSVYGSPYLLEIMIINLLSNMRYHGRPDTAVQVYLDDEKLTFTNPGDPIPFAPEKLFMRFGKTTRQHNGHGLGLSIIRQICLNHHWEITYHYRGELHVFEIRFSSH